jgi:hypothetical protein
VSADDDAPSPEELREAAALARALEGEPGVDAPADVSPVVHLLRHAHNPAQLPPERSQALAARLRAEPMARARRRRWWLAAPLAAAAAGLLFASLRGTFAPRPPPRPSGALLSAQAAAARGDRAALDRLDREMRGYRRALFRQLGGGQ